jgi:hypothetical protein
MVSSSFLLEGKFFFQLYAGFGHNGDFFLVSITRAPFLEPAVWMATVVYKLHW